MLIPILDTHQHLIEPALSPYSWTIGYPALADRSFTYADYLRAIEGTGIARTVFMETTPDAWQAEAPFACAMADRSGSLLAGVIANARPEDDNFDAYVASIRHPKLVGLRRIGHVEADSFSQQPRFVRNVQRLAEYGLTFDLCFLARQLPMATDLVRQCPRVQFVLDHCGAQGTTPQTLGLWRDHLRQLAALPNVVCKISGVLTYCGLAEGDVAGAKIIVDHCIDCFGWDRVVWGGDWPVCNLTTTLRQWVDVSRAIVKDAAEADQRKLFYDNAARVYGLKGRA